MDERPEADEPASYTSTRAHLSPEIRDFLNQSPSPRRDREDLSYRRPLEVDPQRLAAWQELVTNAATEGTADKDSRP